MANSQKPTKRSSHLKLLRTLWIKCVQTKKDIIQENRPTEKSTYETIKHIWANRFFKYQYAPLRILALNHCTLSSRLDSRHEEIYRIFGELYLMYFAGASYKVAVSEVARQIWSTCFTKPSPQQSNLGKWIWWLHR